MPFGVNINPTSGDPIAVAGSPFSAVDLDTFLGMDPAGKFLYTYNDGDGTISAFTANSTSGA